MPLEEGVGEVVVGGGLAKQGWVSLGMDLSQIFELDHSSAQFNHSGPSMR